MSASNPLVNDAFLAAVRRLEKTPFSWNLRPIYKKNLPQIQRTKQKNTHCSCQNDENYLAWTPYFFPLFPSRGQACLGMYTMLPFFYVVTKDLLKHCPIVNIIEIPFLHTNILYSDKSKESIDESLTCINARSFLAHQTKIDNDNLAPALNQIRFKALRSILNALNLAESTDSSSYSFLGTCIFSAFKHIPETVSLDSSYTKALITANAELSLEPHCERIIPIHLNTHLFPIALHSWQFFLPEGLPCA